jgi:hypothetical protein
VARPETPLKTAPRGSRLPNYFPTRGFGDAGAAGALMRLREIGVEEDSNLPLGSGKQVSLAV